MYFQSFNHEFISSTSTHGFFLHLTKMVYSHNKRIGGVKNKKSSNIAHYPFQFINYYILKFSKCINNILTRKSVF